MREPVLHSHITDELPGDHPLAFETVYCVVCNAMLHAGYNECMRTWLETGKGAYCLECWIAALTASDPEFGISALTEEWGLDS